MNILKVSTQEKTKNFVRKFGNDPYCLMLLRFFGAHPYTRFDRLAIIGTQSINGSESFLEKALGRLVDQGIVKECVENGFPIYSLAGDEMLSSLAMEVASRD